MSTDWQTLRNEVIQATGDIPGPHLENELITRYAENPTLVERAVEKILAGYAAGKIRSAWGALKTELARASDPANNPTHDHAASRHKAVTRAEQWLKNAGVHFDRQSELLDELFGERGILREHDTPELRAHILAQWQPEIGQRIQAEHEAFAARWVAANPSTAQTASSTEVKTP